MELQIQDLVSSIKKDGIDSANKEAAVILTDAKKQADALLAEARKEADKLRQDARDDAEVFKSSALLSAQQAKRDAVLAFSQAVQKEFEKLLASDISKALDEKALADLIRAALRGEDPAAYAAEVSQVTDGIRAELARELEKVGAGFRLAAKDGSGYFDCSQEEIARMLDPFFRDTRL